MEEEIIFEKRTIWTVLKKMLLPCIILLVVLAILFMVSRINIKAHNVMQEARNVRVAMRLLNLECHAFGEELYDPGTSDGMLEGQGKRLRDLSYADGEVILTGWDEDAGMPQSFTYKKEPYLVEYRALDEGGETDGQWDIYYTFHIMQYTTQWDE